MPSINWKLNSNSTKSKRLLPVQVQSVLMAEREAISPPKTRKVDGVRVQVMQQAGALVM